MANAGQARARDHLAHILKLDMRRASHVRGVCKHWRTLCDAPGSPVWRQAELTFDLTADAQRAPADLLGTMRWLAPKLPAIKHLRVQSQVTTML